MTVYIFYHKVGGWTPIEANSDNEARKHIKANPGRFCKVVTIADDPGKDRVVWEESQSGK